MSVLAYWRSIALAPFIRNLRSITAWSVLVASVAPNAPMKKWTLNFVSNSRHKAISFLKLPFSFLWQDLNFAALLRLFRLINPFRIALRSSAQFLRAKLASTTSPQAKTINPRFLPLCNLACLFIKKFRLCEPSSFAPTDCLIWNRVKRRFNAITLAQLCVCLLGF